jgi:hypothetical protein
MIQHRLSDGGIAKYNKGYVLKGVLQWGENSWIDDEELSGIIATIFGSSTSTVKYYPRPDTYPTRAFNVQVVDYNFIPHGGLLQNGRQFYEGTITFESALGELTATSTDVF